MKNLFVLLLLLCVHVNDSYAQFTLEKVFDGYVSRVNRRWNDDFSKEEADDYRSMLWVACRYPLGYFYDFYGADFEAGTYTFRVYDDNYELHTKETYKFQIPNGFKLSDCKMCYAIMEEPIFLVLLYNDNYKDPIYKFRAYNTEGKMIDEFGTSSHPFYGYEECFESKGKLCFLVQQYPNQNEAKTFLYSVDYPSSLVKSMLAKQPAVIVAPDRLTVFSTSGKSEVLKIYTINGELYDSKALDTEGKTTYMTTGLEKGMYIYEVGGESGKFVVK